ncbi:MAG: Asp/Glu racemase [Chromatiales bacterium]|jgi:allantoin racemase|nr:Asp/Glu racemase [Chromatiales bacterium]
MSGSNAIVRVINPNSNAAVTAGMSRAVEPLRSADGPQIDCITLSEGPFGVESLADVNLAERLLMEHVQGDADADAFVLGCYSDPGFFACQEVTSKPIFGIQQCAALLAIARGGQFGVISLSQSSVERHMRHLRVLGLENHCAGDRPANLTVAESESGNDTFDKLLACAKTMRDSDGARSIILGCTGMAGHRDALEAAVGIPVIEPTQAAVAVAVEAVRLGWG